MLEALRAALQAASAPAEHSARPLVQVVHGAHDASERAARVARFDAHPGAAVFLVSIKACGMGINLTGATTAVLMEPDWNPTVLSQAAARCHRIGQTRPVQIVRLTCAGTFETKMQVCTSRRHPRCSLACLEVSA